MRPCKGNSWDLKPAWRKSLAPKTAIWSDRRKEALERWSDGGVECWSHAVLHLSNTPSLHRSTSPTLHFDSFPFIPSALRPGPAAEAHVLFPKWQADGKGSARLWRRNTPDALGAPGRRF